MQKEPEICWEIEKRRLVIVYKKKQKNIQMCMLIGKRIIVEILISIVIISKIMEEKWKN